jgi:hypothetical protein
MRTKNLTGQEYIAVIFTILPLGHIDRPGRPAIKTTLAAVEMSGFQTFSGSRISAHLLTNAHTFQPLELALKE